MVPFVCKHWDQWMATSIIQVSCQSAATSKAVKQHYAKYLLHLLIHVPRILYTERLL